MIHLLRSIIIGLMVVLGACATGIKQESVLRDTYPGLKLYSASERFHIGARCRSWRYEPGAGRYFRLGCDNGRLTVVAEWSDFYISRDPEGHFIFRKQAEVDRQKRLEIISESRCQGAIRSEELFLKSIWYPRHGQPGCFWVPTGLYFELHRELGPDRGLYVAHGHIMGRVPIILLSDDGLPSSLAGGGVFRFEQASYQPGVWIDWSDYLAVFTIIAEPDR